MSIADEIRQLAGDIIVAAVGLPLLPSAESAWPDQIEYVSGLVGIDGVWNGIVGVHCSPELARLLTSAVFHVSPGAATPCDIRDFLSELANILGGNLKSVLPGPSRLSLPFTDLHGKPTRGEADVVVWLEHQGQPLFVQVHPNPSTPALRATGDA